MKRIILSLALCLSLLTISCTDHSRTVQVLQKAGYTHVTTFGYAWFDCSNEDSFNTKFRAKNPQGRWITGVVCCGWLLKSCTIRY